LAYVKIERKKSDEIIGSGTVTVTSLLGSGAKSAGVP
jgi:hypothetical protein